MVLLLVVLLVLMAAGYPISHDLVKIVVTIILVFLLLDCLIGRRLSNWFKQTQAGLWIRKTALKIFGGSHG